MQHGDLSKSLAQTFCFTPTIIPTLDVSGVVSKHLNICIISIFCFFLEFLNCWQVRAKEVITFEEEVSLGVALVALYSGKHEQEEHLIRNEPAILVI